MCYNRYLAAIGLPRRSLGEGGSAAVLSRSNVACQPGLWPTTARPAPLIIPDRGKSKNKKLRNKPTEKLILKNL